MLWHLPTEDSDFVEEFFFGSFGFFRENHWNLAGCVWHFVERGWENGSPAIMNGSSDKIPILGTCWKNHHPFIYKIRITVEKSSPFNQQIPNHRNLLEQSRPFHLQKSQSWETVGKITTLQSTKSQSWEPVRKITTLQSTKSQSWDTVGKITTLRSTKSQSGETIVNSPFL